MGCATMQEHVDADGRTFFDLIRTYLNCTDMACVQHAFDFARQMHGDAQRESGELFFTHPLTVAYYLAEYQLDAPALVAALLHDVAEDTRVTIGEIETQFGAEVAQLVDGLTKFEQVSEGAAARQLSKAEIESKTLHKLLGMMARDVRIGIIKLFDRRHNMRTLKAKNRQSQERKAKETLAVYTPLANRLGIWSLKSELEALCLNILHPVAYQRIEQQLRALRQKQSSMFESLRQEITDALEEIGVPVIDILHSPENIYTIYKGMIQTHGSGEHVFTQNGHIPPVFRVVVLLKNELDCYLAVGKTHQKWRPVAGRFDDYIAAPRENLYRALHTTVVYSNGQHVRVRFRTATMNIMSEIGILAKWAHLGGGIAPKELNERVKGLLKNISTNIDVDAQDHTVGLQGVMEDVFYEQQIVTFTPQGDSKELPKGATVLDFAYAVHTEVGNFAREGFVNQQAAPLNQPLRDGDMVEIRKGRSGPHRVWLDEDLGYLRTSYARAHVRRWFRRLSREQAWQAGRQLLEDELQMLGLMEFGHREAAAVLHYALADELYVALGLAEQLPTSVATRILTTVWQKGISRQAGTVVRAVDGQAFFIKNIVNVPLRLCGSCEPRPGMPIVGYKRSDGQVTIHRESCYTLSSDIPRSRLMQLRWGEGETSQVRPITIQINVYDRPNLLYEITHFLREEQTNISSIYAPETPRTGDATENEKQVFLGLEISSPRQLVRILHRIKALVNVYVVRCLPTSSAKILPPSSYRPE